MCDGERRGAAEYKGKNKNGETLTTAEAEEGKTD